MLAESCISFHSSNIVKTSNEAVHLQEMSRIQRTQSPFNHFRHPRLSKTSIHRKINKLIFPGCFYKNPRMSFSTITKNSKSCIFYLLLSWLIERLQNSQSPMNWGFIALWFKASSWKTSSRPFLNWRSAIKLMSLYLRVSRFLGGRF